MSEELKAAIEKHRKWRARFPAEGSPNVIADAYVAHLDEQEALAVPYDWEWLAGRPEFEWIGLMLQAAVAAVVENVPAFLKWSLYPAWNLALQALGYSVSPHIVDAANHEVPQNRERVFIIITRSKSPLNLKLPVRDLVPAESFIDFTAGRWSQVDKPGRSKATLNRIRNGRKKHGDRHLIAYYSNEKGGRSLSRPVGTITTRDRWAIIDGDRMRMLSVDEARKAMAFPDSYKLPENNRLAMHMLGNAVCPPVARDVISALMEAI